MSNAAVLPRTPEERPLDAGQQQQKEGDSPPAQQGYDPTTGLYYYHDGVHPTMYMDPNVGQWCYWSDEGRFFYPVAAQELVEQEQAAAQAAAAAATEAAMSGDAAGSNGSPAAALGPPAGSAAAFGGAFARGMMGGQRFYDPYQQQQQQQYLRAQQQQAAGVPPESFHPSQQQLAYHQARVAKHTAEQQKKRDQAQKEFESARPLPFRLTSAAQSQRERLFAGTGAGAAAASHHPHGSHNNVRKRLDWATAFGDGTDRGSYAARFAGAPSYLNNPPILPPRFYYPHPIPGTYYDFLNVRPTASVEEVEASVTWWETLGYPKAAAANADRALQVHRLVMEAAIIISNGSLRAQYDQTLPVPGAEERAVYRRGPDGLLDVSTHVPRVVHLHQDTTAAGAATATAGTSRATSVTNTPSKLTGYAPPAASAAASSLVAGQRQPVAPATPGGAASTSSDAGDSAAALAAQPPAGPSLAERLLEAVQEGAFANQTRARPVSRKAVARGAEWLEMARRAMNGGGSADDQQQEGGAGDSSTSTPAAPSASAAAPKTEIHKVASPDAAAAAAAAAQPQPVGAPPLK